LGPRITSWARAAWRRNDLQQIASVELEALGETSNMNATLSIRDNDNILYLGTFDVVPVRYAASAGERAPLYCTAAGKVFLAFMQEDRRVELVKRIKYERFTEYTIRNSDALFADLKVVRKRGYSLSIQEEFFQVMGIAAPIWNANKEVVAAISLWTLTEKTSVEKIRKQATTLIRIANKISADLAIRTKIE
jgi:DNA-binding IclR family transcriptional regulator